MISLFDGVEVGVFPEVSDICVLECLGVLRVTGRLDGLGYMNGLSGVGAAFRFGVDYNVNLPGAEVVFCLQTVVELVCLLSDGVSFVQVSGFGRDDLEELREVWVYKELGERFTVPSRGAVERVVRRFIGV